MVDYKRERATPGFTERMQNSFYGVNFERAKSIFEMLLVSSAKDMLTSGSRFF